MTSDRMESVLREFEQHPGELEFDEIVICLDARRIEFRNRGEALVSISIPETSPKDTIAVRGVTGKVRVLLA